MSDDLRLDVVERDVTRSEIGGWMILAGVGGPRDSHGAHRTAPPADGAGLGIYAPAGGHAGLGYSAWAVTKAAEARGGWLLLTHCSVS